MDAKKYLKDADKYPYELMPGDNPIPPDYAHRAARGCLSDLCDRKAIGNVLDDIDLDTRKDIIASLAAIIREAQKDAKQRIYILKDDYAPDAGSRVYGVYSTSEKASEFLERYEGDDNEFGRGCDSLDVSSYIVE